jgi:penicillin-binding protein 1C
MGMSLEGLVQLYAALADDGHVRPLVFTQDGGQAADASDQPFLQARSRRALAGILADIRAPGDRLPRRYQETPHRIAFKTGTSYGFRDAWAIGFDARYTVGVWVGRADGTPLPGRYGSATAAPVLFDVFDRLPGARPLDAATASLDGGSLPPALRYFDRPGIRLAGSGGASPLEITFPEPDTAFERAGAAVPLSLVASGGTMPLQWFVNGQPLPRQRWSRKAFYRLEAAGFYRLSVVDADGNRRASTIRVTERAGKSPSERAD